jgi:hypothetical protein
VYKDDDADDEKRMSDMIYEVSFYSKQEMVIVQEKTGRKTREEKSN